MRVTQQMLTSQMLTNLHKNLGRLDNYADQLSSGKKIRRPSDDPVGLSFSLRYRSEIAGNNQYQRNLDTAISWLEYTDTAMGQVSDLLQRVKELAVQGATESNSSTSRVSIAEEIQTLYGELREIANTDFNGKFIFNGHRTDQPPYPDPDSWQDDPNSFDQGNIRFEVSKGHVVNVNHHAGAIFGSFDDDDNAFKILQDLAEALLSNDTDGINEALGLVDSRIDKVLEVYAEAGARMNRLEMVDERIKSGTQNLTNLLSKTEDADVAEVLMFLQMEENVYRASLAANARIIQPSLLDFLR